MSIFRVHDKTGDFTIMSNYHLRDKNLSLKAKGLLSWMLSNKDNWDYSIAGIVACCKEGETTVNTALKELQKYRYVVITRVEPDSGNNRIHYIYDVYEKPQDIESQGVESQGVESQGVESQGVESQGQINTNKTKTKEINTKEINTKERNTNKDISISKDIDMDIVENIKKSSSNDIKDTCIKNFIDMYHNICISLPKVRTITDKRKKAIMKIVHKYSNEDIEECLRLAESSGFLTGKNDRGWKADIDFILREDKFVSILEGKYKTKYRRNNAITDMDVRSNTMSKDDLKEFKEAIKNGELQRF